MVTTPKLTYQDYANMDGDERYELHDGELILIPSPNTAHQTTSMKIGYRMFSFVEENDLGQVFSAPYDVLFSDTQAVQPDILFVSNEREHIRTPANIQGAPDMIVEVLSPSSVRRDWSYKRELYASYGVREYWIVDPVHQIVSVMLLQDEELKIVGAYTQGDTVTSSTLEGFSVSLNDIF